MEEAQTQHERIAHAEQQVQEMQVEIHKLRAWKNDAIDKERESKAAVRLPVMKQLSSLVE